MGDITDFITSSLGLKGGVSGSISNTSTSGSSQTSGNSQTNQNTDFLSQLVGLIQSQQSGSSQELTTSLPPEILQALISATQGIQGDVNQARDTKANAVQTGTDLSQNAMLSAIQQVIAQGIGNVAELGSNAGAYDSSVQGKAGAQLGAEAAKTGAKVQLDTIMQQQNLANMDLQGLLNNLAAITGQAKGAVVQSSGKTTNTGSQSTTENTSGSENVSGNTTYDESKKYKEDSKNTTVGGNFGFGG